MQKELDQDLEARRQRAIAQMDVVIDVLSAWRGRYEDDDRRAGLGWISNVLGGSAPEGGWLYDRRFRKVFGWDLRDDGIWRFHSEVRPDHWPLTRREFRLLASANGVSLPSRHATLYLSEQNPGG